MNTSLKTLLAITFTAAVSFATHYSYAQSITETQQKQLASGVTTQSDNMHSKVQLVYLNKSTLEQLVTLKGIGHKKAHAIIDYRQQIGEFKTVEELLNIKGVGNKVLEDNQDRLRI